MYFSVTQVVIFLNQVKIRFCFLLLHSVRNVSLGRKIVGSRVHSYRNASYGLCCFSTERFIYSLRSWV